ncbi:MAG: hypothetical protein ISS79_10895 [Phycisphaerae bacterium]|nr:hypothetical protein [Phycisphaerae bacterium]
MKVFILGAGFSRQVELPLATELTELLMGKFRQIGHRDAIAWFESLDRRIRKISRDRGVGIEEVFHYAQFDIEIMKMKQQLSEVGRLSGETPWNMGQTIEAILSNMEYDLVEVIYEKQKEVQEAREEIDRFTKWLGDEDVVITFNYDSLVEDSITGMQKLWNHGLEKERVGTDILKMHGSIDWLVCERGEAEKCRNLKLLFQKKDVNRDNCSGGRARETEYDYELARIKKEHLEKWIEGRNVQRGPWKYTGIAGLGSYKQLHKLPGSAMVWAEAAKSLYKCDAVFVIGFSFSPFDAMVRLVFADVMDDRKQLPEVYVINPYIDAAYKSTVNGIFGDKVHWVKKEAQAIEWCKYLE